MEKHDKLYSQFEEAARKQEQKGFDRMDAVWNRVEDKLDREKERRAATRWKYMGIAAMLLLFLTIGFTLMQNDHSSAPIVTPAQPQVTVTPAIDTQAVKEAVQPKADIKQAKNTVAYEDTQAEKTEERDTQGRIIEADSIHFDAKPKRSRVYFKDDKYKDEAVAKGNATPAQSLEKSLPANNALVQNYLSNSAMADPSGYFANANKPGDKRFNNSIAKEAAPEVKKNLVVATYTGTVVSATDGQPIPGVNLYIKNTTKAWATDMDGKFSIEANKGDILVVSFIGFTTQEIKLGDKMNFTVKLQEDSQALEEVVVIGYGTNKNYKPSKAEKLKMETFRRDDIRTKPLATNNTYTWSNADKDGKAEEEKQQDDDITAGYLGNMEADTNPLYIIDGIMVKAGIVEQLDPAYIKSYKIIKEDDAIKVYGGKAVNGAVIIKTQKLGKQKQEKLNKIIDEFRIKEDELRKYDEGFKIPVDNNEEYGSFEENRFESPATAPLSTFAIDVDNASYTNIRRFISMGQTVPKDAVRIEEMINFFKYKYPQPKGDDPISINSEYSSCPWNPQHTLLKIGLKGKELRESELPSSNYVFLIDVSGSMSDENKLPLLKKSMKLLVDKMKASDHLAIVTYAGSAQLALDSTPGDQKETIMQAIYRLKADGATAGGDGIKMAYDIAEENFIDDGNNRIVLATDGDFNMGASSDKDMQTLIEEKRKTGVFLTCLGFGMGNYKDSKLETLADKGNGNYAYIDNFDEADRFLRKDFNASMYTIAKDVKIQIEFNPANVQAYRLIGYENRKLHDEDFANDAVDAGEMGSGHTVTALYEIIPVGVKSSFSPVPELKYTLTGETNTKFGHELATVKFRYKQPDSDTSTEMTEVIANKKAVLADTSYDFKFAAAVAWFGLKLRDSKLVPNKQTQAIIELATEGVKRNRDSYKTEFIKLVGRVE
ncbi:YfbK domain-containing protein [Flavobacterium sp. RHBU_3]|uniref:vWA domain-containing protein n=1 Tax=Flavobacterium sp. RHBU_3 TaxID=3391184 RepID=UPI0039853649